MPLPLAKPDVPTGMTQDANAPVMPLAKLRLLAQRRQQPEAYVPAKTDEPPLGGRGGH